MTSALLTILVNLLILAFVAGKLYSNTENDRKNAKSWSDGLGAKVRGLSDREDRRWKQILSTMLLNASDEKQKERLAALLRDDSWPS